MQDNSPNTFDKEAATWEDKPQRVALAHSVAQAIIKAIPITPRMEALEYGCGTGLVSRKLAPLVHEITAIDSSQQMLAILKTKAQQEQITNIKTARLDFSNQDNLEQKFDLIVCSMTLHHIPDVDLILSKFWTQLKPCGYLALADLEPEDGSFHEDNSGVAHSGIDPLELASKLANWGAKDITTQTIHSINKNNRDYPVFLVNCQKSEK